MSPRRSLLAALAVSIVISAPAGAAAPRVLPEDQVPEDRRLAPPKDLDGYFPFPVPATEASWKERAEAVRTRLKVTLGLWPEPERTPLNAVIHGRRDMGDYVVEKVFFESAPGFFVTGNLYGPKSRLGKRAGILCPHGHWRDGRFMDQGPDEAAKELKAGAEQYENGARSVLQARCVQLARMGCVVFHYDMLGYADSTQLPMGLTHGFAKQRPEMNDAERWGLFSPQAEGWFQSVMGLQTWNSIRALDFLQSLPNVDPTRLAVTGASGGGTQTFLLGAVDPRPAVAFPAVMVSTAMQGGCTCENACGLRVGTGNVEFAALFAPKPLGLTGANDWTIDMPTKGFPSLQSLYRLLGAADKVHLTHLPQFGHNYNAVSRTAMYSWLNRHLGLGLRDPIVEADFTRLTRDDLTVWDDLHPKPAGGDDFERDLLQHFRKDAAAKITAAAKSEEGRVKVLQPAVEVVLGRTLRDVGAVTWAVKNRQVAPGYVVHAGLLSAPDHGESLPAVLLTPTEPAKGWALVVCPEGKAGLFGPDGTPNVQVARLLGEGYEVLGLDLLYQGEFLADGRPVEKTRRVKNTREAAAYTFGYNHTLLQQRVHDVLTGLAFLKGRGKEGGRVRLVAQAGAGHWAACARAVASGAVTDDPIDVGGFRFAQVREIHHPDFVPGGAKYLDTVVLSK